MEKNLDPKQWNQMEEVELIYRSKVKASERPVINDSKDAYQLCLSTWDVDKIELQEQFKVLFLNRANRVLGFAAPFVGGLTATVVDPRIIFATALKINACSIVLCHNHPSGAGKPSRADEDMTLKFKNAGLLLDIKVLDHIILFKEGYSSFADMGLL